MEPKPTFHMAFRLFEQIIVVFLCPVVADVSCKGEAGEPVDW